MKEVDKVNGNRNRRATQKLPGPIGHRFIMMRAALALAFLLTGCAKQEPLQLWYWHHSYLVTADALHRSEILVDRAAAAGYTGMALWDSSLIFVNGPNWPAANIEYLKQLIAYAHGKGPTVMPAILPYGHSDDVLKQNFNWAEGSRVVGVKFRRRGDTLQHVPMTIVPLEKNRFLVEPWHQYEVRFPDNASGPVGALDDGDFHQVRLDDTAHAGAVRFTFNSGGSNRIHVFGPTGFTLQEAALVNVVRREGAPFKVYDERQTFLEGQDFTALPIRIPPESRIRDGQDVFADYYAISTVYGEGLGLCLTEPQVQRWSADNARLVASLLPPGSPLFLQHDEMRHMNSCVSCKRMNKTPGELLAWSLRGLMASLPARPLYIWSDMFDPWHNAHDHFYYVEGDLRGSWEGLPKDVTVMNWNNHRRASLEWFEQRGNAQIIAGYYDPPGHDGYRSARAELAAANGIRGIKGLMFTTWNDDYSQLEAFARGARAQWPEYVAARPW